MPWFSSEHRNGRPGFTQKEKLEVNVSEIILVSQTMISRKSPGLGPYSRQIHSLKTLSLD